MAPEQARMILRMQEGLAPREPFATDDLESNE